MAPHRVRPLLVSTGRHPFEIAVLTASVVCGVALLVTGVTSRSVQSAMPGIVQVLWQILLTGGGVIGLIGVMWPGRLATRLGCEAVGVSLLGTGTTMYAVAIFAVSGAQGITAGAFVAAIAVASWARIAQIAIDIRKVALASMANTTTDVTLLAEER